MAQHIDAATAKLEAIPKPIKQKKWQHTIAGVGVAAAGAALVKWVDFPVWFGIGAFGFGCFIASKELLVAYLKFIPAAIRDVMAAARGKNGQA